MRAEQFEETRSMSLFLFFLPAGRVVFVLIVHGPGR